jgi:hypothetical protein
VRKLKAKREEEECLMDFIFLKTWLGEGAGKKRGKKKLRTRRQANNWRHHLLRDKNLKGSDG